MYTLTSCSWFAIFSNLARMLLDWPPVCAHDNIIQNLTEEVPILTNGSISCLMSIKILKYMPLLASLVGCHTRQGDTLTEFREAVPLCDVRKSV